MTTATITRRPTKSKATNAVEFIVDIESAQSRLVEMLIFPDGEFKSSNAEDGEPYVFDEESWDEISKEFNERRNDMVIDYEHQTEGAEYSSPDGTAPAAGWIKSLRYEKGRGLVGIVEWTPRARSFIERGEYKYMSPVYFIRKKDRKVVGLRNVALTNQPALHKLEPVVAKDIPRKEPVMNKGKTELIAVLGDVAKDKSDEELMVLATERIKTPPDPPKPDMGALLKPVCDALGNNMEPDVTKIVARIGEMKIGMVPASEVVVLKDRLAAIEKQDKERQVDAVIAKHTADGKLNPHNADQIASAKTYATNDPAGFEKFMAHQPKVWEPGQVTDPNAETPPTSRLGIISKHAKNYDANPKVACGSSRDSWINSGLTLAGLPQMTTEEAKAIAGKVGA